MDLRKSVETAYKQTIIAMSGRKGAGKNTIGSFIRRYYTSRVVNYAKKFMKNEYGIGYDRESVPFENLVSQYTLECSFADNLKDFCIRTLGIERYLCYGSDEVKNTFTRYSWDEVDLYLRWKFGTREMRSIGVTSTTITVAKPNRALFYKKITAGWHPVGLKEGPMSAREIMQIFGTELVRETFGNVWAEATVRRIKSSGKQMSVVTDNQFPNEIKSILAEPRGFIIRLTRSPYGIVDLHPSEASLDDFDWDRKKCYVLDNASMTIEEQNQADIPIIDEICDLGEKNGPV